MLLAVVAAAVVVCPTPLPNSTPPPEIGHVRASPLCTGLRNIIGPSIYGLRLNDGIISQGQSLMGKLRADALGDPRSNAATGGAGASSEMDDFQMTSLVAALTQNLERVETMLNDASIFPARPASEDERALDLAKDRLEAVAAEQRSVLNILATTVQSNQANDLASKCDPVDCPGGGVTPARLSLPKALASAIHSEQNVESDVAPAIVMLVQRCRGD